MATTVSSKCSHTVLSCQTPSRLGLYLSTSLNLDGTSDYFWPTEYSTNDAVPLRGIALNWPDSFCFLPLRSQPALRNRSTFRPPFCEKSKAMWRGPRGRGTVWRERERQRKRHTHQGARLMSRKPYWRWILQPYLPQLMLWGPQTKHLAEPFLNSWRTQLWVR